MLLKIANENHSSNPFITVSDVANREHLFSWNEAVGAYCCDIADQQQIDDIFAVHWTFKRVFYHVVPVAGAVAHSSPFAPASSGATVYRASIPPYVRPELYDAYPIEDLLALCANDGFAPEGDLGQPENIKRQLRRYYEGRAWAVEENRRMKSELSDLKASQGQRAASVGTVLGSLPAPTMEPPTCKPDRAAAARAGKAKKDEARRLAREAANPPGMARAKEMQTA